MSAAAVKKKESGGGAKEKIKCSFCHKSYSEVEKIISAPNGIYICDGCVQHCVEILASAKDGTLDSYRP